MLRKSWFGVLLQTPIAAIKRSLLLMKTLCQADNQECRAMNNEVVSSWD